MKCKLLEQVWQMTKLVSYGIVLQCFLLSLLYAADSNAQRKSIDNIFLDIDLRGSSIQQAFSYIETETGLYFAFSDVNIDQNVKIDFTSDHASLRDVLNYLAEKSGLQFKRVNETINISRKNGYDEKVVEVYSESEQDQVISGKVTSDEDKSGLPGVNVIVKGTSLGTVTDVNGDYSVGVPSPQSIVVFSSVGFISQEIVVGNQSSINVVLLPDVKALDEIVVIGYGSVSKEKLVTPVSSVDPELVKKEVTNSLDRSLEGKIAGLNVKQGSGAPGGGSELQIRGASSIGAGSQPLIVIDGIPMQESYDQERSMLSLLNQADITSIDVLKGASATAIYGSRGSNGVILVTTARGAEGKTDITFSANVGFDNILPSEKMNLMNAEEFARWRKEDAYDRAAFYGQTITDDDIPEAYRNPESLGEGTDWYDQVTQTGFRQDYNVSIAHGTKDYTGFFSIGYLNHEGTVKETGFERISMRANMAYSPNDVVKMELMVNPTIRTWDQEIGGDRNTSFGSIFLSTPLDGPFRDDGPWERDNPNYYDEEWDLDIWSPGTFSNFNSLHKLKNIYDVTNNLNLFITPSLEIKPIENLVFRTQYNIRLEYNTREYFRPSTVTNIFNPPPNPGSGYYNTDRNFNWQWENTATYNLQLGGHGLSALAGFSMERYNRSWSRLNGDQYPSDAVRTINASIQQTGSTGESNWSMMSYFMRLNYDYNSKYLFTATLRRDGSSRFGPDNRWGSFPSFSAGWNVSKEDFFPESRWLTNLKFRGGYGTSGNNNIGDYTWIPTLAQDNYTFGGSVADGQKVNRIQNSQLGWEKAYEYSVGMDLLLFDGRISLDADYYNRTTEGMLWAVALPTSSGFNSIQDNIGEVRNTGFEFSLGTTNIINDNFTWNTNFNISFNRNEVLDLGAVDRILTGWKNYSLTMPGQPMAMFFGWEQLGVFRDQAEIDDENNGTIRGQLPGTPHYRDLDGNGTINQDDDMIIGNPHPAFRGGLINTFAYKKFDLSIALSFAHDFDVFSQLEGDVLNLDGVFNVLKVTEERWRSPEQPGNGTIPASIHQSNLFREPRSTMVNNASFLKAQNITLGYTLPNLSFGNSLRVYSSVQNAFLWTNYKYGNPDINRQGASSLERNFDGYDYPISRTIIVGVDFTF
jgi:TonB-linked SusC/RagA family outer membrane protein